MTNRPVSGDYLQGDPNTHPGVPVGEDRVPAWLAPNEFVVNAEATEMYGPQIEAMNNHGRAVQQQAEVPPHASNAQYFAEGGSVAQSDMFSGNNWDLYRSAVASIESAGHDDPYSIMGGFNKHYVGKYQLGSDAIGDAARFLKMETVPSREQVRKDPAMQERLFNAFTQANHASLLSRSEKYRNMDPAAQQRVLGYAHNQGAGGANEYLRTGQAGVDGWGTSGLKYSNTIGKIQGDPSWKPSVEGLGRTPAETDQMLEFGVPVPDGVPNVEADSDWLDLSFGSSAPHQASFAPTVPVFVPTDARTNQSNTRNPNDARYFRGGGAVEPSEDEKARMRERYLAAFNANRGETTAIEQYNNNPSLINEMPNQVPDISNQIQIHPYQPDMSMPLPYSDRRPTLPGGMPMVPQQGIPYNQTLNFEPSEEDLFTGRFDQLHGEYSPAYRHYMGDLFQNNSLNMGPNSVSSGGVPQETAQYQSPTTIDPYDPLDPIKYDPFQTEIAQQHGKNGTVFDTQPAMPRVATVPEMASPPLVEVANPLDAVFSDPAYAMMSDRSGLGVQGYWDSLDPAVQEQHLRRVGAEPAIFTNKDEIDVLNTVGANSGFAASPEEYNLGPAYGSDGSPMELSDASTIGLDAGFNVPGVDPFIAKDIPVEIGASNEYDVPKEPGWEMQAYVDQGFELDEAQYQAQQMLEEADRNLLVAPVGTQGYDHWTSQREKALTLLGRSEENSGSLYPRAETPGTHVLDVHNEINNAETAVGEAVANIETAASSGDYEGVAESEAALAAAHAALTTAKDKAQEIVNNREINANEESNRLNTQIQLEVMGLDNAIENATTDEGRNALIKARDDLVERHEAGTLAPPPPANGLDSFDMVPDDSVIAADTNNATPIAEVKTKVEEAGKGEEVISASSTGAMTTAGEKAIAKDPSTLGKAFGSLKSFFGDMFDATELKRMAVLYVGARVTGASHGSSLAFAGKSYLTRMNESEKLYKTAAASDKYTKSSVAKFKTSKDPNDLELKKVAPKSTGEYKNWYTDDGTKIVAEKIVLPNGDKAWFSGGRQIDPLKLHSEEPDSAHKERMVVQEQITPLIEEMHKSRGRNKVGESKSGVPQYEDKLRVGPLQLAEQMGRWAQENDFAMEDISRSAILDKAMTDMYNDADRNVAEINSIVPYLEQNMLMYKSNMSLEMFRKANNNGKSSEQLSPMSMVEINAAIIKDLKSDGDYYTNQTDQELLSQAYSTGWEKWDALEDDEKRKWEKLSSENTNGFLEYMESLLN